MAASKPVAAPVTIAILPSKRNISLSLSRIESAQIFLNS
jgi:hypothetical protein